MIPNQIAMTALAEQVASHLDGSWSVDPFPDDWGRRGAWLREEGGAILSLGESQALSERNKNRLTVGTDYPKEVNEHGYSYNRPRISVSGSKTGVQVAADIARRLLPEYLPILEKALKDLAGRRRYENATSAVAGQIAGLMKVPYSSKGPKETTVNFYHSPYHLFRETLSKAEIIGEDEVELSLRLSPRDALRLLNMLVRTGRFEDPDEDQVRPVED